MVNMIALVFLLIAIVGLVYPFGPKVGPYDIEIEKLENCKDQGEAKIIMGSKITKAGRGKYLYKENFTFLVPMDEHFKEYIEVQKWGNGGWRPKYMETTLKDCNDIMKVVGDFYKSLMKSAGLNLEKCPVPAGSYKANGWLVELNLEKTVPVMEYGKYRAFLNLLYKEKLVGCMMIYAEIKPKAIG
ncbi:uncharacterized protein LOC128988195 [Macrosteles quadrilineatus]|uniref:uncharacterized protein LOC128988195 n=1 Tax=Macrosteles quadrilineatus TaxID=74068 RepID=UPI0023E2C918|nr:uncharacterized protein LOC128988195 [Macrosteles quadrilineatus]